MKYCSVCAGHIELKIPEGDNRPRHVCEQCGTIHYQNPRIVAGTLPTYQGKILLCKRAIEPRMGYWTLPAGFMENGESTEQAALRETWEEALAKVEIQQLFSMISVVHIDQVHIFYTAVLPTAEFSSGPESLEVALFAPEDIPWDELAFSTVEKSLRLFLENPAPARVHTLEVNRNR